MKTTTYTYKSKATAIFLALFFGGMGGHRFYLGHTAAACGYVVGFLLLFLTPFFWLPALAAVVDLFYVATQGPEYFKRESGYSEVVQ